jgi:long-chain acyl-CoA synthetase
MISADFSKIAKGTNMEDVEYYHEGCDTLYKAFNRNVEKIPNHELLGTRTGMVYNWLTFKQVSEEARGFAAGCQELNLCPEVDGDGRKWRFLGIQAKNRKEWGISHIGNFHAGVTTIALYDTLGVEAAKYVVNQTELTTVALQGNLAANMIKMKQEEIDAGESEGKMRRLSNLIVYDKVDDDVKKNAEKAGITIYHIDDVIAKGKEKIA